MTEVMMKLVAGLRSSRHYVRFVNRGLRMIIPLYGICGLRLEAVEDNLVRASVPLKRSTRNHIGIMHASVLYLVGELLGGIFITHRYGERGWIPIATEGHIEYLGKVRGTATAECELAEEVFERLEAEVAETGRGRFTTEVSVRDPEGTEAARLRVEYLVKAPRKDRVGGGPGPRDASR